MLIQMPRGSSDRPGTQNAEECNAFEAALRRDLASAPVISYEMVLGGVGKRAIDLTLTVLSAPIWLPLLAGAALWSKLHHSAPVFQSHERIGYGGVVFKCYALRIEQPSATVENLRPAKDGEAPANDLSAIASQAENRRAKWRRAFERLPRLFNVLRGDMSLVGPSPLGREDLEPLKTAKRHYLSMRPGVVGISAIVEADEEEASQYKIYALSWSATTDMLILSDALRSLRNRGELWQPSLIRRHIMKQEQAAEALERRKPSSAG
jgi:exopolysaccharide production protein ExoY